MCKIRVANLKYFFVKKKKKKKKHTHTQIFTKKISFGEKYT